MATKIKVGDEVVVRKGSNKGKSGKVLRVDTVKQRVLVEGVNVRPKHQKANQLGKKAGIFKEPRMLSISNVGLQHPAKKQTTGRIGFLIDKDGTKKRIFRANGKEIK